MAQFKYYRSRINTLRNMKKVMSAMRMIATIKTHKLLRFQASLGLFEKALGTITCDMTGGLDPSLYSPDNGIKGVNKKHVVIFTADRGMCGSHNSSIYKAIDQFTQRCANERVPFDVSCIGHRGAGYCKRKALTTTYQSEIHERTCTPEALRTLASAIMNRFLNNEVREIHLISNYFISVLQQDTLTTQLLPFTCPGKKDAHGIVSGRCTEPEPRRFLAEAGTLYLSYKLTSALFNSHMSEHAARMTAMENATANCEDLIGRYVKLRNRARQSSITNALIEIISGKEALKG